MKVTPLAAGVIVATALGLGIGGVLIWNALGDTDVAITAGAGQPPPPQATAGQVDPPPAPSPPQFVDPTAPPSASTPPAPTAPNAAPTTAPVPAGPAGSFDISPEILDAAIADAEANPNPPKLPTRNAIATDLVAADLAAAGYDLSGIDITVFPAGSAPSFVLLTADDSAPLFSLDASADTSGAETFFDDLLASPALSQFEVTNFVLQFSGIDDVGSFELTMLIGIDELRTGLATGADVTGQLAVQVERP